MREEQVRETRLDKEEVGTSSTSGVALLGKQEGKSKREGRPNQVGKSKQEVEIKQGGTRETLHRGLQSCIPSERF